MNIIKRFYHFFEKVTVPLGYVMCITAFIFLFNWANIWKWAAFLTISLITIVVAFILTIIELVHGKRIKQNMAGESVIAQKLNEAMKVWYKNEQYGEVVTFGKALGRALYISANYETRISIGELVKSAAENLGDDLLLVDVLLDDLGWTKHLCGRKDAIVDIESAIKIATERKYYKEICKGYRHLMAIELSEWKDPQKAEDLLNKAYDAYNCLEDGHEKDILLSGLLFASSELAFKQQNFDIAMKKAKESEKIRRELHELDRHMRYYAQVGKIEYFKPNGNIRTAKEFFLKGIDESESVSRIDELVKNAYGYAICCFKLNERKKAKRRCGEILKKYGEIPLYSEDSILRNEYKKIINQGQK